MLLGRRIYELRKKNGLTQEQFGERISVSKVSVSCYEKETRTPSLETLIEISQVFGVDINYLFGADKFVINDSDSVYGMYMSEAEVEFVREVRKNNTLYKQVLEDPKRTAQLINKKIS